MGAGTVDIFGTLNELKTALAGNDVEGIRATLDDLKAAQQQVTRYQAICGTRTNDLEITKGNYEALKENITGLMSNVEDADVTKLVTDFQMKQLALQHLTTNGGGNRKDIDTKLHRLTPCGRGDAHPDKEVGRSDRYRRRGQGSPAGDKGKAGQDRRGGASPHHGSSGRNLRSIREQNQKSATPTGPAADLREVWERLKG